MLTALPLLVVVVIVGVAAVTIRRRTGAVRLTDDRFTAMDIDAISVPTGQRAFVLFTAPGCAPCGPARVVLDELGSRAGMPVVSVDVADHAAVAHAHRVMRAPTTFVVEDDGRIAARIAGVPRAGELTALLGLDAGEPAAA
jgi:hypothetical protein